MPTCTCESFACRAPFREKATAGKKESGRYVSAEFGPRVRNRVERRLAKGEYTLYPSHLAGAGLVLEHEELGPFAWGLQVYYRVAVKGGKVAADSL